MRLSRRAAHRPAGRITGDQNGPHSGDAGYRADNFDDEALQLLGTANLSTQSARGGDASRSHEGSS